MTIARIRRFVLVIVIALGAGGVSLCSSASAAPSTAPVRVTSDADDPVGRYKILRDLARGGFGGDIDFGLGRGGQDANGGDTDPGPRGGSSGATGGDTDPGSTGSSDAARGGDTDFGGGGGVPSNDLDYGVWVGPPTRGPVVN
ncbi:hypothetical protein ACFYYS_38815 [Streptomyces sp. NPDC002120]|uniref:hypothetical protein n=1 Tax=Streptomyces sp. NPDC002120 TaxID=3364631 RepID=UPI00368422F3